MYQARTRFPAPPENSTSDTSNGAYSPGFVHRDRGGLRALARFTQPLRPPLVEPVRLLRARTVFAQPLERQVVPGHS